MLELPEQDFDEAQLDTTKEVSVDYAAKISR